MVAIFIPVLGFVVLSLGFLIDAFLVGSLMHYVWANIIQISLSSYGDFQLPTIFFIGSLLLVKIFAIFVNTDEIKNREASELMKTLLTKATAQLIVYGTLLLTAFLVIQWF